MVTPGLALHQRLHLRADLDLPDRVLSERDYLVHPNSLVISSSSPGPRIRSSYLSWGDCFSRFYLPSKNTTPKMTMDSNWSPDYCLACDRQTSGGAYCSQACRLVDLETSSCASESASPTNGGEHSFWERSTSQSKSGFYLQPAFDFGAHRSTNLSTSTSRGTATTHLISSFSHTFHTQTPPNPLPTSKVALTPSSSQSSLTSMQSRASQTSGLSAQAKSELRSYTNSFDCIRNWKRRMTSPQ